MGGWGMGNKETVYIREWGIGEQGNSLNGGKGDERTV